jgi:hypothetical protein
MASFLGTTISTADANKIIAAYTSDDVAPELTDVEVRVLTQVQSRVRKYEDNAAVLGLTKSTFDITS